MGRTKLIFIFLTIFPAGFLFSPNVSVAINWNEVLDSQVKHDANIPGTNHPHFIKEWRITDTWNGNEGYYRWRIAYTQGEDDDGYVVDHPNTSGDVYLSAIIRVGSTWWEHHTSSDRFKLIMFYNTTDGNPRPTVFNAPVFNGSSIYSYRSWGPDIAAGGSGVDEFGQTNFNLNYPSHSYQENANGHNQWYFVVAGIVGNYLNVYMWSQDGTLDGSLYAQSQNSGGWGVTWSYARLLAYIEATTAGDANSYMDVSHISVHNSFPNPPAGFINSAPDTAPPGAPTGVTVI